MKYVLTPDDWCLGEDEVTTAEEDKHARGWWIIKTSGGSDVYLEEEEIAELYRIVMLNKGDRG